MVAGCPYALIHEATQQPEPTDTAALATLVVDMLLRESAPTAGSETPISPTSARVGAAQARECHRRCRFECDAARTRHMLSPAQVHGAVSVRSCRIAVLWASVPQ
jgi:hypothetical protein